MSRGLNCVNCQKGVMYGHNVSHAKNRTKRLFVPNLHTMRIPIGTAMKPSFAKAPVGKRVRLCTKCLRKLKREMIKKEISPKVEFPAVAAV